MTCACSPGLLKDWCAGAVIVDSGWRLEEVTVLAMPQTLPLGYIPMWMPRLDEIRISLPSNKTRERFVHFGMGSAVVPFAHSSSSGRMMRAEHAQSLDELPLSPLLLCTPDFQRVSQNRKKGLSRLILLLCFVLFIFIM